MKILLKAFRTLEQIEADLDAARLQSAALAALIAPATKMFQFDEAATNSSFETTSPILLQHLRSQSPCPWLQPCCQGLERLIWMCARVRCKLEADQLEVCVGSENMPVAIGEDDLKRSSLSQSSIYLWPSNF
ncbi:unnamed protein product [Toxocara canis]|uniref:Uncharacterized protein n=1 Tax=Toxocara canis TaxID=6265 RepID=A0A183UIJ6_TOXCA|nr:unnamed protein product [Toxocara canis]